MALPCYVSTEWEGVGHATLRFRPKNVPFVEKPKKKDESKEAVGESTPSWPWFLDSLPSFFSRPIANQHPVRTHTIDCYLSSVYIREYGERKRKEPEEAVNTSSQDDESVQEPSHPLTEHKEQFEVDLRPPGITSEIWNAWMEYWSAWSEVLIPLSWVHKYRNHCTPEYISWHDSYLESYPDVLSLITDELGISELKEDDPNWEENLKHENKKILDELYAKHVTKRYLVHLRSFLHQCGMECDQEVDAFFKREAGIDFNIQTTNRETSTEANPAEGWNGFSKLESHNNENGDNVALYSEVEESIATNGDCNGDVKRAEGWNQLTKQESCKGGNEKTNPLSYQTEENISSTIFDAGNESEEPQQLDREMKSGLENNAEISINEPLREYTCINLQERNSSGEGNDEDEGLQQCESGLEKDAEISTEPVHQSTSLNQQGRSVSGRDENSADEGERKERVSDGGTATVSSGSDEKNVNDAEADNASSQKSKKSKKRRRNKNDVRQQGVSGVLQYLQKNVTCENNVSHPTKISHTSDVSCEVNQHYIERETQVTSDGDLESLNTPARSASVEAMEKNENVEAREVNFNKAKESEEKNLQTFIQIRGNSKSEEINDESVRRKPNSWTKEDEEEREAFTAFFDESDQNERLFWKRYYRKQQKDGIKEMFENPPTVLSKVISSCCDALKILNGIYLTSTALHLLNVALPGTAVMEYVSSVTEDEPGERYRLWIRFDYFVWNQRCKIKKGIDKITNFCKTNAKSLFLPVCVRHLSNLVLTTDPEMELKFPRHVFGVWWLPDPNPRGGVKNIQRHQRRFHTWLMEHNKNIDPSRTVRLREFDMYRVNTRTDERESQRLYQKVVKEETEREESNGDNTASSFHHLTLQTIHPLKKSGECGDSDVEEVVEWDADGSFSVVKKSSTSNMSEEAKDEEEEEEAWNKLISGCQRLSYWEKDSTLPKDLPKEIQKYWAQRYRFFLKYDQGIKLDEESWYSVTPEVLAAHQARRCKCEVVVDAMCGAGGNAIQLAKTCSRVIAIDKDPKKVELARHNAQIYGVADRIEFRVGNFFKLAPYLKADVVYLSPPWGGMKYLEEEVYNVYQLGRTMNCVHLLRAARTITHNLALYLPRNSDICQVIALAGVDGRVDIETSYMGSKMKAITAYFGDLANDNRL